MKRTSLISALALVLLPPVAFAQNTLLGNGPILTFDPAPNAPLNRFGASYRMGFNISVDFKNLGGLPAQSDPGPIATGINHEYDDGHNRVDNNNTESLGLTWYWCFKDPSQQLDGDNLLMHSSRSAADGVSRNRDGDPQHGFELTYARHIGEIGRARWGAEAAFNWTDLTVRDSHPLKASLITTRDTYPLYGLTNIFNDDGSPYCQTNINGPGPLITNAPSERVENTMPNGATITGSRRFDAQLFGGRIGPYIEFPLTEAVSFTLGGGLALVGVHSQFSFRETVALSNGNAGSSRGSGSGGDLLVGGYVAGSVSYALNEAWMVFAGAQYQNVGTYTHRENGRKAVLDLGESVFVTAGVGFSF